MYHHNNPSDRWDKKERKMDEADMAIAGDGEPEKEKVNVVTEEKEDEPIFSGLFCCFCHDYAVHIYDGMSLCHHCFNKEMAELIKNRNKK
jgi:hypothetical protein